MLLQKSIENIFAQLCDPLDQLTPEQYTQHNTTLSGATIGQHVRHIIELFLCLENGYKSGKINYDNRERNPVIEADKEFAKKLLTQIQQNLDKKNKSLLLEQAGDATELIDCITIETNYHREIAYNLEHTIHHMALIRVGLIEIANIQLPESFGLAPSTIKYRKECAQ
ncbi:MAG TPA: hypothetical protein VK718_06000 [Ferruginibacter sp.]|jgi:hypothetical protein|nr:hypothetical protein [Ferruginibacter sp.]